MGHKDQVQKRWIYYKTVSIVKYTISLEEAFDQKKHKIKQIYTWNPTTTGLIL